jgi:hypothetical protein
MKINEFIRYPIIAVLSFGCSTLQAEPPSRVARLSSINGNVSFLPAGENEWLDAVRNRPLISGDRLWNDTNGFSRVQLGGASLCIGPNTNINVLNLDNNIAQFQLTEGSLNFEVNSLNNKQTYEIDTPNVAFSVTKPGTYRVDVDKSGDATIVQIANGQGEVYGDNSSYIINSNQAYRFTGTSLNYDANFQGVAQSELDQWCNEQKNPPRAVSSRYVSDVIGYEDLESAGTWETIPEYGAVWTPNNVDPDWAPYSNGHWAWIEPWGWNWIGQEDWGFAPYHYGRWVHHNRWYWMPYSEGEAVYAPALVAFIGAIAGYALADQWHGNVGWYPLGPGDIYRPPYAVSYNYFANINRGDRINQRLLREAYRNPNAQINYRNRNVRNAITAVPQNAFVQSQNVSKARVNVNANQLDKLPSSSNVALKPQKGVANNGAQVSRFKPSESALSRQVISKARVPTTNEAVAPPKIREVKPSKPRDISNQRNNRVEPIRDKDERFNQPLPKRHERKEQNDSTVPERFRQTMPEYDPSGGKQLRPKPSNEPEARPNRDRRDDRRIERNKRQLERQQQQMERQIEREHGSNQDSRTQMERQIERERGSNQDSRTQMERQIERERGQTKQDLRKQQRLERQQQQMERQIEREHGQTPRLQSHKPEVAPQQPPFQHQHRPDVRQQIHEKAPQIRQQIQEKAPEARQHIRERIEQKVQPQIQHQAPPAPPAMQHIQHQAPPAPAPPPVQQIQRAAPAPLPQAAPVMPDEKKHKGKN